MVRHGTWHNMGLGPAWHMARPGLGHARHQQRLSAMAKDMADSGSRRWYSAIREAVHAYNNTGHSHLLGNEPSEVKESEALTYELRVKAGEDMKHNKEIEKRYNVT